MKKNNQRNLITRLTIFLLLGVASGNAQINDQNKLMKKDTMEQDKTRVVIEKNIRDTSQYNPVGDTAIKNNRPKKKIREDSMYLVPSPGKKSRK